jgi:hypothetical protein
MCPRCEAERTRPRPALRAAGLARRSWFDRFDARGPHIAAIVTLPSGAGDAARERLASALDGFFGRPPAALHAQPGRGRAAPPVLSRHGDPRRRRRAGHPAEGSYLFFGDGQDGYAFWLTRRPPVAVGQTTWVLMDALSRPPWQTAEPDWSLRPRTPALASVYDE